jgi:hypothetical protein
MKLDPINGTVRGELWFRERQIESNAFRELTRQQAAFRIFVGK